MNYSEAEARARILKAVAHPIRVLMLDALSRGSCCVNDLMGIARVGQSTISRHLAQLKRAGIVTEERKGARIIHHLACPCMLRAVDCSLEVLRSVRDQKRVPSKKARA